MKKQSRKPSKKRSTKTKSKTPIQCVLDSIRSVQTAQTAPTERPPVTKAEAQGQQASPRNEERPMGMSPIHAAPFGFDTDSLMHARNQDASRNFRTAAMNHASAVAKFRQAELSDYSAISDAIDNLFRARYNLITARQCVLDLNRTND